MYCCVVVLCSCVVVVGGVGRVYESLIAVESCASIEATSRPERGTWVSTPLARRRTAWGSTPDAGRTSIGRDGLAFFSGTYLLCRNSLLAVS